MKHLFTTTGRLRLAWLFAGVQSAALVAMPLVLSNGLPPGGLTQRMEFVATHQFWWSASWLLWALAGLLLILFFIAWFDSVPLTIWSLLGVGLVVFGGMVDWAAQAVNTLLAPEWAARATADSVYLNLYSAWDRAFMVFSPGFANLLDTVAGIMLTVASLRIREFPRWLAVWGLGIWLFGLTLAYSAMAGEYAWITPVSAALFGLFIPWIVVMAYRWLTIDPDNIKSGEEHTHSNALL